MSEIEYVYPLILNKVTSPHYVTPTLRRSRLLDFLHANVSRRAIVIAADAGYGKTTLLWQWEREIDAPCYWYKLDRNDRDWTLHISYLIEAISTRHQGFGQRANSMLRQLGGPGSSRPAVAGYLLAEMQERLTEPCTFIIDDWQYVNAATDVRGLWNQILRDAPPTCRFVFASRGKPQLQFARFKTHAAYAELRTPDFRLTDDEIDALFRDVYGNPLSRDEVDALQSRTEGWAASLQLIDVSMRDRSSEEDRLAFIGSLAANTDGDLFSFLAEEVLDQQSVETQNLLLTTSILQQVTPELAERLGGVFDGRSQLTRLEQNGLFIHQVADDLYRYHGLFRDFLSRRLSGQLAHAELGALHIHAASYFETSRQWPEAIHHYLQAGLKRQAARLIARFGEEVASEGRIGLADAWLAGLPPQLTVENARLSLLHGETLAMRGDYPQAISALERARRFFARKGDARMEALACLKLSSTHTARGDPHTSAQYAEEGLALAPDDARSLRLRLEGNFAITALWTRAPIEEALAACQRVADEAQHLGLDHYSAIGLHNAGILLREIGNLDGSRRQLEAALASWAAVDQSPYIESTDLIQTLLALGRAPEARLVAVHALEATRRWKRPWLDSSVGMALVDIHEGLFAAAIDRLRSGAMEELGGSTEQCCRVLLDALVLDGRPSREIEPVLRTLERRTIDPRTAIYTLTSMAVARHLLGTCDESCGLEVADLLQDWRNRGGSYGWLACQTRLAWLRLAHRQHGAARSAAHLLVEVSNSGGLADHRWWIRRFSPYLLELARTRGAVRAMGSVLSSDPEHWRRPAIESLPRLGDQDRAELLGALERAGTKETIALLRDVPGKDVATVRRKLRLQMAQRFYVRGFGSLTIHRGSWTGPVVDLPKKRVRALVALLAGYADRTLTREMIMDLLWPDAGPAAAVNSLNQTVYQLRRVLSPDYQDGESPAYVLATSELVQFNPELVRIDHEEIRRLSARLTTQPDPGAARTTIALVRGQFLGDLKYEDWAWKVSTAIHSEVRELLLPIAEGRVLPGENDIGIQAACALIEMDEFDETAVAALVRRLSRAGRKAAAHESLRQYVKRARTELGEMPSAELLAIGQEASPELRSTPS